ncbi:MAG: hypothetical protein JWP12_2631 [Bacteroidetes bacterium]|nr:hypothetical protein [Bacteroidota bacterium]
MIASDELYKLVKSLSQSEKRFFKIYASRHVIGDGNDYVRLFDAIALQKSYNEAAIREKFKEEPFLRRFAAVKNYLQQLIIKSMRSFHSASTIDIELKEMLIDIDFLYQKGLYKQCQKLHLKAEKLAIATDKKNRLLEILEWKAKLLQVTNNESEQDEFHKNVFIEESKILNTIKFSLQLKSEVLDIFTTIRKKGFARSAEDLERMKEVVNKYNKYNYSKLTFNDKYYINYINTVYHSSNGNNSKSFIYTKRNVDLLESIPEKLREEEFEKYIIALNNLVVNYLNSEKNDSIHPYLSKIRSLATHNIRENILLWVTSYKLVLGVSMRLGDYEQAERIANEIGSGINFYADKIPVSDIALFKYNMSIVYFANNKHSKAIRLLNEIINEHDNSLRDDIQSFARILRLIVFWEKGEQEILPYTAVSTYRFLYKRKRLYKFETIVLHFIKEKLPHINTNEKRIAAFKELKLKLEELLKEPFEKKALEYFDFITWVESKISKKEFKVLAKEKFAV